MEKNMTDTPSIVAYVKISQITKQPISYSTYIKAIDQYPEYFPEEIEYQRKFKAIPEIEKEYHDKVLLDSMDSEMAELEVNGYKRGIMAMILSENEHKKDVFNAIIAKHKAVRDKEEERFKKRWDL